jgi:hypothetical protein
MYIHFNMKKMIVIAILTGPLGLVMADGAMDHQRTAAQEVAALNVGSGGQGSGGGYGAGCSSNGGQVETIGQIGERLGGMFQGLREAL